jgi:Domain of unknown function (DUF4157)
MIEHSNESQHDVAEPVRAAEAAPAPDSVQRAPAPVDTAIAAAVGTSFSVPPSTPRVQRMAARPAGAGDAPAIRRAPTDVIRRKGDNDTGLPDSLKAGIERLSGFAMDDVKVHFNSSKPAQVGAHAYALGTDIHVASGQERHLPHEAWHVVQQKQGRVKPTTQISTPVERDDALEAEATKMGDQALNG